MPLVPGTHRFGPENGTLSVRTGRSGAAAKAGHDLLLHVTAWQATLELGEGSQPTGIVLDADATSLRVREGTGGMQPLGDDDKANIEQTIDDEVLKGSAIRFRSTSVGVAEDGVRLAVTGDLTLLDTTKQIAFDIVVEGDDVLRGSAVVRQTDWGIKPYSALFGALKVADEVEVAIDASARLADPSRSTVVPGRTRSAGPRRTRRLRPPVLDPVVASALWALVFFVYLVLGMLAVGESLGIAGLVAVVASFAIFVFVRTQGAWPRD